MKFFDRSHKVLFFMSAVALFTGAMFYFQQPTAVNNTPQSLAQNTVAVFEQPSSEPTQPILAAATKSPETNEATAQKLPNRLKNHRDLAQKETLAFVEKAEEDAAAETEEKRNVEGRAEAEFKMIKNPKTGKMPHDVHIKSIAAAKKTRALQLPAELNEDGVSLRSLPVIGITPRGPNNYGGRTLGIGIDKRNSMNVLAGGASSGIFRSTNGGASWTRVTPSGDIHSVTAIAQDTRAGQEDTWYCGSGESSIASPDGVGALYYGNGLWKSTDNGVTWAALTSTKSDLYSFDNDFDYIYRIVINPNNGDVLVSASETIKRSSDGGATWSNVLGSNNRAEKLGKAGDVIYNVASNTFYASIYGSNTAGGIYNSTDGIAWTKIATPTVLGNGPLRIVLANVANTANVLAFYETTTSPCSTNKVALQLYNASMMTWTNYSDKIGVCAAGTSNPKVIKSQGGYNMCIATKPDDANTVYFGGTEIYRLNLATFAYEYIGGDQGTATATNLHVDNHYLTFDPNNNNLLWACNDGGMRTTVVTGTIAAGPTGGFAWTDRTTNYTTHQYYGSDISPINGSTFLAGAAQDNAFTIHPTDATAKEVGPTVDGVTIGMISGTSTADFNAIIAWQDGAIARLTDANGKGVDIQPDGEAQDFLTYFHLDNDNSNNLYYPTKTKKLFRTRNATAISAITIGDASTAWEEITAVAGTLTGNISQMATTRNAGLANAAYTASNAARTMYIGTDDGKVYRLADPAFAAAATAIPINITPTGATGHVSGIAVNSYNDKEVLVSYSNYGVPSVWYTADASVATPTWVNVEGAAGTAVELASARSVAIVQAGSTVLYLVGTSTGLYGTTALSGATTVWERVGASDIALSPVISLRLRASDNKMCVGTHGNGLFMLSFPSSALPLDLLSFEAIKVQTKAELKWTAANEVNFSHYNVQKSDDGKYFTSFAKVAAKSARVYQAIDENPSVGQNYYRLEMVDTDGKKRYSKVLSLVFGSKDNKIAVYPNPSSDNTVTLDATFDQNTDVHITWTDIAGRTRLTKQQTILQGTNQIAVDISTLENGVYFITTRNAATNDVIRTIRFFKQ